MYWGKIGLHSLADQNVHRLEKMFNEISRKSNLNRTTWLKFCDGRFTIFTPINCFVIYWKQRFVWSRTDTLTITSTSQLIVTSAHYTVISKALHRKKNLVKELIEVTLVPVSLSTCAFWKKSAKCIEVVFFCTGNRRWLSLGPYLHESHAPCYVFIAKA